MNVRVQAVERLGDRNSGEAFTDAGRPGENQARRQRIARDRSRQQIDQTVVADDVPERHGSGMLSRANRRSSSSWAACCPASPTRHSCRHRRDVTRSRASSSAARPAGRRPPGPTALAAGPAHEHIVGMRRRGRRFLAGAEEAGQLRHQAVGRMQIANRRRLGSAGEVLGVDHRPVLELSGGADDLRVLAAVGCEACPTGGRRWPW